jgi:hypothetical protein
MVQARISTLPFPFGSVCVANTFIWSLFSTLEKQNSLGRIEQMVQLHNFFITSMVVPRGTAAPVLFKWFVSRDVPTGAPSSNGTIIPIPIPSFPLLVYLHSRKLIRSTDGAKSYVLVRANRPILLPDIIEAHPKLELETPYFVLFPFFISFFSNPRTFHI